MNDFASPCTGYVTRRASSASLADSTPHPRQSSARTRLHDDPSGSGSPLHSIQLTPVADYRRHRPFPLYTVNLFPPTDLIDDYTITGRAHRAPVIDGKLLRRGDRRAEAANRTISSTGPPGRARESHPFAVTRCSRPRNPATYTPHEMSCQVASVEREPSESTARASIPRGRISRNVDSGPLLEADQGTSAVVTPRRFRRWTR